MQQFLRLLLPVLLFITTQSSAQDIHFTNFRMAPLTVNPALTGAFQGTYRISGIYRGQWTSISSFGNGFHTPHLSLDLPLLAGLLTENDWIGVGISIVSDRAGFASYRSGFGGTSATYHLGLDKNYSRVFSIGFQYGRLSNRFSDKGLRPPSVLFDQGAEQINFDGNGNTQNMSNTSISIGATYKATINDKGDLWRAGLAMKNIGPKNGSFISDSTAAQTVSLTSPTLIGFGEASMVMTDKIRINPALIFQSNSGSFTLEGQATADYLLNPEKQQTVTAGLGYRLGDSVNILGGIQVKDIRVGFAYDITVSGLSGATRNGAFEISVGYIGKIYKKPDPKPIILCPRL